jgi:hypothetical protein
MPFQPVVVTIVRMARPVGPVQTEQLRTKVDQFRVPLTKPHGSRNIAAN